MIPIKKIMIILMSAWIAMPGFANTPKKKHHPHHHHSVAVKTKKNIHHAKKIHSLLGFAGAQPNLHHLESRVDIPTYFMTSVEKNLVKFVRNTIESIRYTAYKLGGTKIDPSHGIYVVDCSSYVDHILKTIYPKAYTSLTKWSGTQKPTTYDFYHYFITHSEDSRHWSSITDVEELRPGDILVFRSKNRYGVETGGHIMIVMEQPERNGNIFSVRIADAAPSGHSEDTRQRHASGIGIGNMLLKVNPHTSRLDAYAWKVGSRWESNVNFAMARPVDYS